MCKNAKREECENFLSVKGEIPMCSEHIKVSPLTGKKVSHSSRFSILTHSTQTSHPISFHDFSILSSCNSPLELLIRESFLFNKQLLDETEHDIKNYPDRGQCYLPKTKAEAIDARTAAGQFCCFAILAASRWLRHQRPIISFLTAPSNNSR